MSSRRTQFDSPLDNVPVAWSEHNLLSLDGGGVRGYWSLLVLKRLMQEIGAEERRQAHEADPSARDLHSFLPQELPPNHTQCVKTMPEDCENPEMYDAQRFLPCHYFDLICGSSTGSLIAIMLSRFRMTVDDCLEEYKTMSKVIFGKPRWISQRNIGIVTRPKYSAKVMQSAFEDVTARRDERLKGREKPPASVIGTHEGTCLMFAVTLRRVKKLGNPTSEKTHLLRSYVHERKKESKWTINYDDGRAGPTFEVCYVARAATAAPMYFKEVKTKTKDEGKIYYSDGGFGRTNNPTELGKNELQHYWYSKDSKQDGQIGTIVSVGTARAKFKPGGRGILQRIKQAFNTATDPQSVADAMADLGLPYYWRLNDEQGLDVEMDHWKPKNSGQDTLRIMEEGFDVWAEKEGNSKMIRQAAHELVKRRRLRTKDRVTWDRFASVAEYTCSRCRKDPFHARDEFDRHFERVHKHGSSLEEPAIKIWEYPGRPISPSQNGILRRGTTV